MLKRAAYERLVSWKKDPHHRALLVDGARQVGKTYLVRAFAQRHYGTTIEINFVESPEAKAVFAGNLDADTLIPQLSAFSGTALTPGDTLIFLDEIQECPRARTAIKFLVEDGRLHRVRLSPRRHLRKRTLPPRRLRERADALSPFLRGILLGPRRKRDSPRDGARMFQGRSRRARRHPPEAHGAVQVLLDSGRHAGRRGPIRPDPRHRPSAERPEGHLKAVPGRHREVRPQQGPRRRYLRRYPC